MAARSPARRRARRSSPHAPPHTPRTAAAATRARRARPAAAPSPVTCTGLARPYACARAVVLDRRDPLYGRLQITSQPIASTRRAITCGGKPSGRSASAAQAPHPSAPVPGRESLPAPAGAGGRGSSDLRSRARPQRHDRAEPSAVSAGSASPPTASATCASVFVPRLRSWPHRAAHHATRVHHHHQRSPARHRAQCDDAAVRAEVRVLQPLGRQMCVHLSRRQVRVPEHLLQRAQSQPPASRCVAKEWRSVCGLMRAPRPAPRACPCTILYSPGATARHRGG